MKRSVRFSFILLHPVFQSQLYIFSFVLSVHILLKHISTSGSMRMPSFVSGIAGVAFSIIFVIIFISFLFDFQYCRHILSTLPICRILPAAKHRQNAKAPLPAKTAGLKNKERNEHDGESVLCIEEDVSSSSLVYSIPDFPLGANFCRIFYQPILYRIHQQRKRVHCGKAVLCFAYLYFLPESLLYLIFFVQKKDGFAVLLTFFVRQMEQKPNHSDNCSICQNNNCFLN